MIKAIAIVIIGMFVCLFAFQQLDPNIPANNDNIQEVVDNQNSLSITIEGEVVMPGIYKLANDDILNDLIVAAGGLLESADQDAINLSLSLEGRDYFYIPSKTAYANNCEITAEVEKVNINSANADQLATLSYVSDTLATRIVEYREENGPYMCIEDLMNVKGIGQATYERIRDYVTLKWFYLHLLSSF